MSLLTDQAINGFVAEAKREAARRRRLIPTSQSLPEFIQSCQIYDSVTRAWIPFRLWSSQLDVLPILQSQKLITWLKARQLGATWLCLVYALYRAIHEPIQDITIFSKREREALYLLSERRLLGMIKRNPVANDLLLSYSKSEIRFKNGSTISGFPTGTGDSYTSTLAIIDEADLVPDLDSMLSSVEPTINAGGQLILVSRSNDRNSHDSPFKTLFRAALLGQNDYAPIFQPWNAHPLRSPKWYADVVRNAVSLDDVWKQYPSTPEEALARGSFGKVYPNFSLTENVSPLADYVPGYPIEWWVDDGYINPLVVLFSQQRPFDGYPDHFCIFNEIYLRQTDHDEVIKLALTSGYPPPSVIWYDPSASRLASRFQAARNEGVIEVSNGTLYELVPPFNCQINAADNTVSLGISSVRFFIGKSGTRRLLQIHPRCENTIQELSNYALTETSAQAGSDPRPVKEADHTADAIRYGLAHRGLKASQF